MSKETDMRDTDTQGSRSGEGGSQDQSDMSTSQEMPRAPRSQQKLEERHRHTVLRSLWKQPTVRTL